MFVAKAVIHVRSANSPKLRKLLLHSRGCVMLAAIWNRDIAAMLATRRRWAQISTQDFCIMRYTTIARRSAWLVLRLAIRREMCMDTGARNAASKDIACFRNWYCRITSEGRTDWCVMLARLDIPISKDVCLLREAFVAHARVVRAHGSTCRRTKNVPCTNVLPANSDGLAKMLV